jgi:hypothetical protein
MSCHCDAAQQRTVAKAKARNYLRGPEKLQRAACKLGSAEDEASVPLSGGPVWTTTASAQHPTDANLPYFLAAFASLRTVRSSKKK